MRRKKKRTGLYVTLAVCAVLILLWCVYTRPLSLDYLCKDLDFSNTNRVQLRYEIAEVDPKDGRLSGDPVTVDLERGDPVTVDLERGDPAIDRLIHVLDDTAYRRKLSSLLPETTQTHLLKDGDFFWEVTFTGDFLLRIHNFYGKIEVDYDTQGSSKHWVCSIDDAAWLQSVLDTLVSIAE